ncbi:MAG: S9 family peptidase [Firmicutes bacterium]|nr:S9 family peptidase [Bacillota bacterium]
MKPISVDDFSKFKYLSNLSFSPKGETAAFVVTEADSKANGYKSYIWTYENKKLKKLTSFGKEGSFQYLDEDTLLFPGSREGETKGGQEEVNIESKYYRISLSGGEAELAYTFPIPVSKVIPLDKGDLILLGTVVPGFEDLYKGDKKYLATYKKHVADNKDYEVIEQVPWWWNGTTYTKGAYTGIFKYEARTKKLTWLTKKNISVLDAKISEDKKTLYYITNPVTPLLEMVGRGELLSMNISTGRSTSLLKENEKLQLGDIEIGKDYLLIIASDNSYGINTDPDFYKLDLKTKNLSLYARYGESIGSSVGSDIRYGGGQVVKMEGDILYFTSTRYDSCNLYKLEKGVISPVIDKPGSIDCFDIKDGKILMIALHDMKGQEIYDGDLKQISKFNGAVTRDKYVAEPEILNVKRQGYEVHGFVLKPMNYNPKKKYPVILDVHGGPKTVYGPVFYHEMQYWAGKEYFVIFCNPTGSDGRGAFSDIRGQYGTVDYEDIMALLDKALRTYPSMDKDNLFETGGSYGGFMTNWIIGHTNRFRACASQRSISNWFSFYGVSDIGVRFATDQNASDPWSNPKKLWEHSPIKYADKVKTPTLFIHSFEDYRCPIDQGYQMFTSLVAHGVEARLVCFRGENHELSRSGKPAHRLKRLNEITGWFDSHKIDSRKTKGHPKGGRKK